ncbi:MAG: hypothetical protein AAF797_16105 [Planctomycetota bacterium]
MSHAHFSDAIDPPSFGEPEPDARPAVYKPARAWLALPTAFIAGFFINLMCYGATGRVYTQHPVTLVCLIAFIYGIVKTCQCFGGRRHVGHGAGGVLVSLLFTALIVATVVVTIQRIQEPPHANATPPPAAFSTELTETDLLIEAQLRQIRQQRAEADKAKAAEAQPEPVIHAGAVRIDTPAKPQRLVIHTTDPTEARIKQHVSQTQPRLPLAVNRVSELIAVSQPEPHTLHLDYRVTTSVSSLSDAASQRLQQLAQQRFERSALGRDLSGQGVTVRVTYQSTTSTPITEFTFTH